MNDSIPALGQFMEPSPVPFSLETPGWYVIGSSILFLLIMAGIFMLWNYHKNRYRRIALKQLQQKTTELISNKQFSDTLYIANMMMKQICIHLYSREICADLRGMDWIGFLNETSHPRLFQKENEQTISSIYSSSNQLDEKETTLFVDKTKQWIKHHKHAIGHRK